MWAKIASLFFGVLGAVGCCKPSDSVRMDAGSTPDSEATTSESTQSSMDLAEGGPSVSDTDRSRDDLDAGLRCRDRDSSPLPGEGALDGSFAGSTHCGMTTDCGMATEGEDGDTTTPQGSDDASSSTDPRCSSVPVLALSLSFRPSTGIAAFGHSVLDENGGYFLALTSDFVAYVQDGPANPVVSVQLGADDVESLFAALTVADWPSFAGKHCYTVDDLGSFTLRAGAEEVSVAGCQPDDPDRRPWDVVQEFGRQLSSLYAIGIPVEGEPVRYSVLQDTGVYEILPDSWFSGAPEWPLDNIAAVAFDPSQGGGPVPVWTAVDDEAAVLRALRVRWMSGEWGGPFPGTHQIPIVQADGSRYLLYMRDSVERLENGEGNLCF